MMLAAATSAEYMYESEAQIRQFTDYGYGEEVFDEEYQVRFWFWQHHL